MALSQPNRLKGKDVLFLTRKRQYYSAGMFGIFYFTQYPNIPHHQISCHITLKLSKRSTQRNVFKRAVTSYIQTHKLYTQKINTRYYKLFIVLNKHKLELYEQKIANMDKKDIIIFVQKEFTAAWAALNKKLS